MKRAQVPFLLFLSACLFAAIYAQEFPGMTTCTQQPDDPDPGGDNYGDFFCWFNNTLTTKDLLARDVIFDKTEDSVGVVTTLAFNGLEIGYVWVLNFGRQRGFTSRVEWLNVWETGMAYLQVQVDHDAGRDSRLFLEVYGNPVFTPADAPMSFTSKMEPIFRTK